MKKPDYGWKNIESKGEAKEQPQVNKNQKLETKNKNKEKSGEKLNNIKDIT